MTDDQWRDGEFGFEPDVLETEMDLCLCGRDPESEEVRADMIKVMALSLRFGLIMSGCLRDAAEAFDNILVALKPDEAQELEQFLVEIGDSLEAVETDMSGSDGFRDRSAWLN